MLYDEPRTLLVVYKEADEMILNLLKKLVETKDDKSDETIVGTEDGTVRIVAWTEKIWSQNKEAGNTGDLADKILFIGNIKGTGSLAPVLSIKFNKYGVRYGFAGNQALLMIEPNELVEEEKYKKFLKDLDKISDLPYTKVDAYMDNGSKKIYSNFLTHLILPEFVWEKQYYKALISDNFIEKQLLSYGIIQLYNNDLDYFMKS